MARTLLTLVFMLMLTGADALSEYAEASIPPSNVVAEIVGIGFPYVPENMRASCGHSVCTIQQETKNLTFEMTVPADLIYRGPECGNEKLNIHHSFVLLDGKGAASHQSNFVLTLTSNAKCRDRKISLVFRPRSQPVSDELRDEIFEFARTWRICTLIQPTKLGCTAESPLGSQENLLLLRKRLDLWRSGQ